MSLNNLVELKPLPLNWLSYCFGERVVVKNFVDDSASGVGTLLQRLRPLLEDLRKFWTRFDTLI